MSENVSRVTKEMQNPFGLAADNRPMLDLCQRIFLESRAFNE